jgi:dihydrodipicolinate synthase/N-acetylneuraminate lyase
MTDRALLLVAAATPLADGGARLDEASIDSMVAFLSSHGADGVFACGTTGEGMLLSLDERKQAAAAFRAAVSGTLIVHAGAQTTAATAALAAHAAEIGADGVGVIPPPYFRLDDAALVDHFVEAARACAPLPFYCYAFAARSGYPLPVEAIERIRERTDNVVGLKVSESPWGAVEPYFGLGLPVFIGNEPLLVRGLAAGAVGTVSGLAAAFPDALRAAIDDPTEAAEARLRDLRDAMEAQPFISAVKHVLGRRGVPVRPDVRRPLRPLTTTEEVTLDDQLRELGLMEGVASFAH